MTPIQLQALHSTQEEVTGDWRRLHDEGLHNVLTSPNIIRTIESRRMRWAGHVARMEEMKMRTKVWFKTRKGRVHSEDVGVNGNIRMGLGETG
jgi:hypothetical protein